MTRRRRRAEESSNINENVWLITYSDLVTLMLTFFVLLYSFSTLDNIKWKNVVVSIQGALGVLDGGTGFNDGPPGSNPGDNQLNDGEKEQDIDNLNHVDEFKKFQEEMKKLENIQTQLGNYLNTKGLTSISLSVEERGLIIRFEDSVLFSKGRADLLPQAIEVLNEIVTILKNTENSIRVEGHTDNLPINTERFPSNWELSTSRATNVLRFMINKGLNGKQLSAVGYGEYRPLAANDSEENRRKNRRVDIVILRESLQKNEPR